MCNKLLHRLLANTGAVIIGSLLATSAVAVVDKAPACTDVFANMPLSTQYLDHGNGTLTDQETGYTWFRCSAGQVWADGKCKGRAVLRNYEDAQAWAAQAQVADTSNWRIPEIDEMSSIIEKDCRSPAVDINAFPGIEPENYWSNEDNFWIGSMAWSLFFFKGDYYSKQGKVFELRFMLIKDK